MRQARWSSSAMAAKYTGWVTALGRSAGETEVKRTAEGQGRKTAAQPAAETVPPRLLIIDELGFVSLSPTGAELLFEVFSQCYERGSILVTTNLPLDEWTEVFGSERLTGALLDRRQPPPPAQPAECRLRAQADVPWRGRDGRRLRKPGAGGSPCEQLSVNWELTGPP